MRVDELAEELADFWYSAIADADWDRRLQLLNDIHAQLRSDIRTRTEYEEVSRRFIAGLIERLGAPPAENEAQAQIYASSGNQRHLEAARAWTRRADAVAGKLAAGFVREDRRRFPRHAVDALSEIWLHGHRAPCRLVDLSVGGARLVVREPAPGPGMPLRLAVPHAGIVDARVVFRNASGIGVQFLESPAAA
jgi:hypothetical protein